MQLFIWTPIIGCAFNVATLVICYGLAYRRGVTEWILTPAAIGVFDPEFIIFTVGFTLAGLFYLKAYIMRHLLIRQTISFLESENMILFKRAHELKVLNIACALFGCLGSVILCFIGLRKYLDPYQDLFIIVPYGFYTAGMWVSTWLVYGLKQRKSFFYFLVLSTCSSVAFVMAFILTWFMDHKLQSVAGAFEYMLVIMLVRFMSLYFNDFRNSNFMAIDRLDTNINRSPVFQRMVDDGSMA